MISFIYISDKLSCTTMHTKIKKSSSGFTLVETLISATILTVAAFGMTSALISVQYTSQDSLYGSTALTVALSTLEQMKGTSENELENSINAATFTLDTSGDGEITLNLGQDNQLQIPIVTNNAVDQTMPLTLVPNIRALDNGNGFLLEVGYEYTHPRDGRIRTEMIRSIRSLIRTY